MIIIALAVDFCFSGFTTLVMKLTIQCEHRLDFSLRIIIRGSHILLLRFHFHVGEPEQGVIPANIGNNLCIDRVFDMKVLMPHTQCTRYSLHIEIFSRYGSFHGQDEQFLSRRFSTCRRTPSYASLLPKHQYEVDMPKNGKISVSNPLLNIHHFKLMNKLFMYTLMQDTDKKLYRASMTST